jgi:hypothetical protein
MPRKSKKQFDLEMEWYERRARERVAWGQFSAIVRQRNFNEELARLPEQDRPAFIKKAEEENSRGFYIG